MPEVLLKADSDSEMTLFYDERPGDVSGGLPIIFLHGSGFSSQVFKGQLQNGVLQDRRLIALDMPGHGNSSDAKDPKLTYSYAGFASIVNQFIVKLGIEKCIIAGWSLGGQVAIEMLDSAPHVAGVFAFGAAPAHNGPLGLIRSMHFCKVLLLAGKGQHTLDDAILFERECLHGYGNGRFLENLLRVDPRMRPLISKSIMLGGGTSQRQRVEHSRTPICLLHAMNDGLIRANYMQTIGGEALYSGSTIMLDDCGHAPFLENPKKFNDLLHQFADDVENNRSGTVRFDQEADEWAVAS